MSDAPSDGLLPGDPRQLGPYRVLRRLGAGGMGVVFLAISGCGREVAIKVIHSAYSANPTYRKRFAQEVAAGQAVRSRYVSAVLDAELESDPLYVVTEVIHGTSLELVSAERGLPADRLLALAKDTARALLDMHDCNVVHRDLKPSNVMVTDDRTVVIDFGIAAQLADIGELTSTGRVVGSLPYLAPELLDSGWASPASDVFSWGCLIYYAATGRAAFFGAPSSLVEQIKNHDPDVRAVPGVVREVVARALAKHRDQRPTVREILDDLGTVGAEVVLSGEKGRSYTAQLHAWLRDAGMTVRVCTDPESLTAATALVLVLSERPDAAVQDMRLAAQRRGVTVLPVLVGTHAEPGAFLDARTGALPDAAHLRTLRALAARERAPAPAEKPSPEITAIGQALANGNPVAADRLTTAALLAAAGCADRTWAGRDEVALIGARFLRDCAQTWDGGTGGRHGFLAQRRLMADARGTEVADLARLFGWGDPRTIPADYENWVADAGPGFFPTLRCAPSSGTWFDRWNITVSAVYKRVRMEF
jgi:eukaryotic-like serine/threonine-protein kinase